MGVPKFYRWISERYPCLSEKISEHEVPDFDNFYLDMNGIIHNCTHPNDGDPHFRMTEEKMFIEIMNYIDALFRHIKPKKVFFMAVDGVAPRAKLNQQRGRRFRTIKEAELNVKKAIARGEVMPTEKRFDHNCITPGTKFMIRLQKHLEYFVQSKITTDANWQGLRIFLSGHETPGEGEHKIMEFIRYERSQPGYNADTRHCLYGLDADLMMLGLCTHEPHFSLLREEVRFGSKNQRKGIVKVEETIFYLLHLSLMREYIGLEFQQLKETLSFPFDLEKIIDDWVLMGFLVGNDFVPHLPNLHINHEALPLLYETYKKVAPNLDGYINENGVINMCRLQKYLDELSSFDIERFESIYSDFRWLESKKKSKNSEVDAGFMSLGDLPDNDTSDKALQAVKDLASRQGMLSPTPSEKNQDITFNEEFMQNKRNYYCDKLKFKGTSEEINDLCTEYVRAMQWICHYYYHGVQSWSWFYPYHYAPFISDLKNIENMDMTFDFNKPFLPYQQLLAVLPVGSKECVPEVYWDLFNVKNSPIGDYYPDEFELDLNGKRQDWEAVVLIPFIDENRLTAAMQPRTKLLSAAEKKHNMHNGLKLFEYDSEFSEMVRSTLPDALPDIAHSTAKCTVIPKDRWVFKDLSLIANGLLERVSLTSYLFGFPTLNHLKFSTKLLKAGVQVFTYPSKSTNMILQLEQPDSKPTLDEASHAVLGKSVHVRWPHLVEAQVVKVSDVDKEHKIEEGNVVVSSLGLAQKENFYRKIEEIKETSMSRKGVDYGETDILVYVKFLLGNRYEWSSDSSWKFILKKEYSQTLTAFPLQAIVQNMRAKQLCHDEQPKEEISLEENFPVGSTVYKITSPNYGCQGKVLGCENGVVHIEFTEINESFVIPQNLIFYMESELEKRLSLRLRSIFNDFYVSLPNSKSRYNLGLGLLKHSAKMISSKYVKTKSSVLFYSEEILEILTEYKKRYPQVLSNISKVNKHNHFMFGTDAMELLQTDDPIPKLEEIEKWIKSLNLCHIYVPRSTSTLNYQQIEKMDQTIKNMRMNAPPPRKFQVKVRPSCLYKPVSRESVIPDPNTIHYLLERIVMVRDSYTVPLNMRGTIIAKNGTKGDDNWSFSVMFDEEFVGGTNLGGLCPDKRGYVVPQCSFISLTKNKSQFRMHQPYLPQAQQLPHTSSNIKHPAFDRFNNLSFTKLRTKPHHTIRYANDRNAPSPRMKNNTSSSAEDISKERIDSGLHSSVPKYSLLKKDNRKMTNSTNTFAPKTSISFNNKKSQQLGSNSRASLSQAAKSLPVLASPQKSMAENRNEKNQEEYKKPSNPDLEALNNLFKSVKIRGSSPQPVFEKKSVPLTELFANARKNNQRNPHMEGAKELNELLLIEQQSLEGKNTGKWSTEPGKDDPSNELGKQPSLSVETNNENRESAKEKVDDLERSPFVERSSSVERASSVEESKPVESLVERLKMECKKLKMLPPIYSYFTQPDKNIVSTVQLSNGAQFNTPPCGNKDMAMEKAAQSALSYLAQTNRSLKKMNNNPPFVSNSLFGNNAAFPQYGLAPHPYQPPTTLVLPPQAMQMMPPPPMTHHHSMPPSYHPSVVVPHYGYSAPPYQTNFNGFPPHAAHGYFPPQPMAFPNQAFQPSYMIHANHRYSNPVLETSKSTTFIPLQVSKQQVSPPPATNGIKRSPVATPPVVEAISVNDKLVADKSVTPPNKRTPTKARLAVSFTNPR